MVGNKNPNLKQPGEKPEGEYHYNQAKRSKLPNPNLNRIIRLTG
jgi:hypothetical protein